MSTVRITTSIGSTVTKEELVLFLQSNRPQPKVFFAESSDGSKTATVTFEDRADAVNFCKRPSHSLMVRNRNEVLTVDEDFLGFTTFHDAPNAKVDIVSLHGLNGHAFNAWTFTGSGPMWLRDFLPTKIPDSRILIYGYRANVFGGTMGRIRAFAENFLEDLRTQRLLVAPRDRPIVFIGHSMGGLVIKKALLLLEHEHDRFDNILNCVTGVIFMGTPHGGGNGTEAAKFITKIIKAVNIDLQRNLIKALKKDSRELFDATKDFRKQVERTQIKVVTLYEREPMKLGPWPLQKRIVIVEETSATLGCNREVCYGINAHHVNMCKFKGQGDVDYKRVSAYIDELARAAPQGMPNGHIETRLAPPGGVFSASPLGHHEPPQRLQEPLLSYDDGHLTGRRLHFASLPPQPIHRPFGDIRSAARPTFLTGIPRRAGFGYYGLPSHHPEASSISGHRHLASPPQATYHPLDMRSQARPTLSNEIPRHAGFNNYNSDGANHPFPTGTHILAGSDGEHLNVIPAHGNSQSQTIYPQQNPGGLPSRPDHDDDSHFVVHAHPDTPSLPVHSSVQSIHSIGTPNWLIPEKSATHVPTGYQTSLTDSLYASMPILHTTNLPNSNILADIALSHFTIDVSPWKDPMKYIDAEANHVNTTIQKLRLLTEEAKIDEASFTDQPMIYSRLIVYIFAHSMLCTIDNSLMDHFARTLQLWKTWDHVTRLQNHHMIKGYLQGLYPRLKSHLTMHPKSTFHKLLTLDTISLLAHLTVIVMDDSKRRELLGRRGPEAQSLLNLLQARLNFPIHSVHEAHHTTALIVLSKASKLVPEGLAVKEIQVDGDPFTGGGFGFGDIHPFWDSDHPDPPSFTPEHPTDGGFGSGDIHPFWEPDHPDPPPRQSSFQTEPNWLIPPDKSATINSASSSLSYFSLSIIHRAVLPKSKISLDAALSQFVKYISPWTNPMGYITAEADTIHTVIQEMRSLTGRTEIELASFTGRPMPYSRLIAYIFSHLMLCTDDKSLLNQFTVSLHQWQTWSSVTSIQNHQLIKDYLQGLYQVLRSSASQIDAHPDDIHRKLLALDTVTLAAHLAVIVTDNDTYKELVSRRGQEAQSLLDLLQDRMDIDISPEYKHRHMTALIKLSKASGLVPECLVLNGFEVDGDPIARGGFGDVYKGRSRGQEMALKVLRVYQKSDIQKLLKDFSCEAVTWRQLSHPNVLPFYGVFFLDKNPPRLCLASPWLDNGNVVQYLAERAPKTNCVPLILDIAQGLEYLHGSMLIHGDMKGLNILISGAGRACIRKKFFRL